MRRLSTALLSVALVGMALAGSADACSCAPQAPAESLKESDAAIVARLVKVLPHGRLQADYRYEVLHVYRGRGKVEAGRMLTVRSGRRAAACALPRRPNHRYGLFLARRNDHWFGGICGVIEPGRLRHAAQSRPRAYRRASSGSGPCGA
ncbi:MAG TPA: hypothetical protein VGH58_00530 [Solirubrobacterales bacterium]